MTKDSAHKHFNPRSREGSDHSSRRADRVRYDFNSRSREGSDASLSGIFLVFCKFQSALPRGERPLPGILQNLANNFNPRSREGSDLVHTLYVVPRWDFNPRSHKGSDNVISGLGISVELFQSALPRGERRSI